MIAVRMSAHAQIRASQRAIGDEDIALVFEFGKQFGDDVFFLGRKDAELEIRRCKQKIQRLERLRNMKIVSKCGTVVTCYQSRRSDQKKMFRNGKDIT